MVPNPVFENGGSTLTCYDNGAFASVTVGVDPSAGLVHTTTHLVGADGRPCVDTYGIGELATGINRIDLVNRRGQHWTMTYTRDGLTVGCPNGRSEEYSLEQAARAECGGSRAACVEGVC
jgi:hypothetical protein